jgi:hypothetical protein
MDTIIISYEDITKYKNYEFEKHPNYTLIQDILTNYTCFKEAIDNGNGNYNSKWNRRNNLTASNKERPKIGNKDISKEAIITKDFQSLLNKLTNQNFTVIQLSIKKIFIEDYIQIYIDILWKYFQKQPVYQDLYIKILENIYTYTKNIENIDKTKQFWNEMWNNYLSKKEWQLSKIMVEESQVDIENSENYQDYCDFVKEKKRLLAVIEVWARLLNKDFIKASPYKLLTNITNTIHNNIDINNNIDNICLECYIEQCTVFIKSLNRKTRKNIPKYLERSILKLEDLQYKNKSCKFKMENLILLLKK